MTDKIIAGRYHVQSVLGEGGMGTVYLATDTRSNQQVAIKVLKPEITGDTEHLERFKREGEALRQLNHPNIVKMLDALEDDGIHYLVLEYVEGGDLASHIGDNNLTLTQSLNIALDLADALTRAHRLNIIHRDIKPANVLIAPDGTPRLTDFGVAHMGTAEKLTETGSTVGTIAYIAPEVIQDQLLTPASDVWSFGMVLYEMLIGKRPFVADTLGGLIMAIITQPLPDLESIADELPIELIDLLYRMLDKDPKSRISSVRLVGAELEAILQGTPLSTGYTDVPSTPSSTTYGDSRLFATPTPQTNVIQHNLPPQPTQFVGRDTEIDDLRQMIDRNDTRLVTILGSGGMGKTRLALEVASQYLTDSPFKNGIYFVDLSPLADASYVPETIASTVGLILTSAQDSHTQLIDYFREKAVLLMMDNYEHVLESARLIHDILLNAPQVKVIVTSRESLNIRTEQIYTLSGMDFPDWESPEDALEYSAVKLFLQSARRTQPGFEVEPDDLPFILRICKILLGMPLGIELAASWVDMLSLEEIVEEIQGNLDFLETEMRDMPERHRSMRAVFEYSWNLMDADDKVTFAKLSVFRGQFTRKAAQTVTGVGLRSLGRLVNKSLLRRDGDTGNYAVHALLRQYAEEELNRQPDADAVHTAHSQYYLKALADLRDAVEGQNQVVVFADISHDIENVRVALMWGCTHQLYDEVAGALRTLWRYFRLQNKYNEGLTMLESALETLPSGDDHPSLVRVRCFLLACLIELGAWVRRTRQTKTWVDQLRPLLEQVEDEQVLVFADYAQGKYEGEFEDIEKAREFYLSALERARKIGDSFLECEIRIRYGDSFWNRTPEAHMQLDRAREQYDEAHTRLKELDAGPYHMAQIYLSLGNSYQNRPQKCLEHYQQSLAIREAHGFANTSTGIYNNLALASRNLGRYDDSLSYIEKALVIALNKGNRNDIAQYYIGCTGIYQELGHYLEALAMKDKAEAYIDKTNHPVLHQYLTYRHSEILYRMAQYDEALKLAEESVEICMGFDPQLARWRRVNLVEILRVTGDLETASDLCESLLNDYHSDEHLNHLEVSWIQSLAGRIHMGLGNYDHAREYLKQALEYMNTQTYFEDHDFKFNHALMLSYMIELELVESNIEAAQKQIINLLELTRHMSDEVLFLYVLASIIRYRIATDNPLQAVELATLVIDDSRTWAEIRDRMQQIRDDLKGQLLPDDFAGAVQRGELLDIMGVMDTLRKEFLTDSE